MANAPLGDDVFMEDPSVNALQKRLAQDFGKEAALFCASGTMANQIAIKVHTQPGDQVICSWAAHVYHYEGGGMARHSGATAKLLPGDYGLFKAADVETAILAENIHYPVSRLVVIEDTSNKGGGAIWPTKDIKEIAAVCFKNGLSLHLDGARLYNRLVADKTDKKDYASSFDSISICLSKSLGAPVGSVLLGTKEFIKEARRIRKVFGGGMRQAGMLAAAGSYALDHHVDRLKMDHQHAKIIAEALEKNPDIEMVMPVATNIILFDVVEGRRAEEMIEHLEQEGVLAFATGPRSIRFVLHLDVNEKDVGKVVKVCNDFRF
jgi:threonine aldolase